MSALRAARGGCRRISVLLMVLGAALGLSACAGVQVAPTAAVAPPVPTIVSAAGHRIHLVRESNELRKTAAGDERVRVEYAWDYSRGIAVRRVFAGDAGVPVEEDLPVVTLNATEAERAFAFALVRADRRLAARITPSTTLFGGFSYREPGHPACDVRSRCIHVVGSADGGQRHALHAIVDLMSGTIVDPDHDPGMRGIAQDEKKRGPKP